MSGGRAAPAGGAEGKPAALKSKEKSRRSPPYPTNYPNNERRLATVTSLEGQA